MNVRRPYVIIRDIGGKPIWLIPVVNPSGTIKYLRVNQYAQSSIVKLEPHPKKDEYDVDAAGNRLRAMVVQFKPGLESEGWTLVASRFHECGPEGVRQWAGFQKWMLSGPMAQEGATVKPWPDKYLPPGIKQAREAAAKRAAESGPEDIDFPELEDVDGVDYSV